MPDTSRDLPDFARFWMVCRKPARQGDRTEPRQRYSTRADAEAAAARLAREADHPYLILEAVAAIRPGDPVAQEALL